MDQKEYTLLGKKRGMKKREEGRISGAPNDDKFDFQQRFLLLFLRPAKNQWTIYFLFFNSNEYFFLFFMKTFRSDLAIA